MARHQSIRFKPKKRPNRYNPNAPDYAAVHSPLPRLGLGLGPLCSLLLGMRLSRMARTPRRLIGRR